MIFVPLPLFATLCLLLIMIQMVRSRDMNVQANQLFFGLVALYALQSLLLSLRWGYGYDWAAIWIALLAPVLPIAAYFAYLSLMGRLTGTMLWPLAIVGLNWIILGIMPGLADVIILMTYLGFGFAILRHSARSGDGLALVRIGQADGAMRAMIITGIALICSAITDMFVIVDFIRTQGQNVGLSVTLVQTIFLLSVGLAAVTGQSGGTREEEPGAEAPARKVTQEDDAIVARLTQLFETEALHHDTDLNLRRLSRRLGLPSRSVSLAINKTQNESVSQFVNGFRIRDACVLLEETDQTILQVSLAAGFMTKSNFNREFARVTNQTPSEWRKLKKMPFRHN